MKKLNISTTFILLSIFIAATLGSGCSKDNFDETVSGTPLPDSEAAASREAKKSIFKVLELKNGEHSILIEGPVGDNDDAGFDIAVQDSTGNEIEDAKVFFSQSETTTLVIDFEVADPLEETENLLNGIHTVSTTINEITSNIIEMQDVGGVLYITVD